MTHFEFLEFEALVPTPLKGFLHTLNRYEFLPLVLGSTTRSRWERPRWELQSGMPVCEPNGTKGTVAHLLKDGKVALGERGRKDSMRSGGGIQQFSGIRHGGERRGGDDRGSGH